MKFVTLFVIAITILTSAFTFAQTPPSAFEGTTVTFNLTPISLPGAKQSVTGQETDILLSLTPNNQIGETTLINSSFIFAGGRYNRLFPKISNWLNNVSPNLNGMKFQFGLTGSLGVVKIPGAVSSTHWGERAGVFTNYQISNSWALGFESQWDNFPGYAHNTYSIAFGPAFHF